MTWMRQLGCYNEVEGTSRRRVWERYKCNSTDSGNDCMVTLNDKGVDRLLPPTSWIFTRRGWRLPPTWTDANSPDLRLLAETDDGRRRRATYDAVETFVDGVGIRSRLDGGNATETGALQEHRDL